MESEQGSATAFHSMGDDMGSHVDDVMEDDRAKSSTRSMGSRRGQANDDLLGAWRETSDNLRNAILEAADKMANPSRKMVADVAVELRAIAELNVENAHEWLTLHKDMAHILSTDNKRDGYSGA